MFHAELRIYPTRCPLVPFLPLGPDSPLLPYVHNQAQNHKQKQWQEQTWHQTAYNVQKRRMEIPVKSEDVLHKWILLQQIFGLFYKRLSEWGNMGSMSHAKLFSRGYLSLLLLHLKIITCYKLLWPLAPPFQPFPGDPLHHLHPGKETRGGKE